MKISRLLFLILLLAVPVVAQIPVGEEFTFSTSDKELRWSLWSQTYHWENGPFGEENYQDHTFGIGFNVDSAGTKIVPSKVSFSFTLGESQYRNGEAGQPGSFMSEHFFSWCSPYNTICIRPFGWTVQYDTGDVSWTYHGEMNFFRNDSNGGGQWGLWHDNGYLDLTNAPDGSIGFKNNSVGLRWATAAGDNSIAPLYIDNLNRVILGGGGQDTIVNSVNLSYTGTVKRGNKQILGAQCAAIDDPQPGEKLNNVTVIAVLNCLRQHGLVASN